MARPQGSVPGRTTRSAFFWPSVSGNQPILLFVKLVIIIQVNVYNNSMLCNNAMRFIGMLLVAGVCVKEFICW